MIQVRIVDYAGAIETLPSVSGTTMVLSQTAFGSVANSAAKSLNIEFQQQVNLYLNLIPLVTSHITQGSDP
ncbi:hypothetical protein TB2_017352 [Malus domestica]